MALTRHALTPAVENINVNSTPTKAAFVTATSILFIQNKP
jgi:hypothetical protein